MDDLSRLVAIEEIRRLKGRYFYCLDNKDWDGWKADVFAPDATMDVPEARVPFVSGIDAIIAFVAEVVADMRTVHHGHSPIIDIESETSAKAIWAMEDVLFAPPGRFPTMEGRIHGYGHYRETYERLAEGWRIKTLRLSRLHLGPMP
jgi:hypothetical protein